MNDAKSLRAAIKNRFYPFATDQGFVRGRSTSLFAPFQRKGIEKVHLFEVQWDKYHYPRFVLNFSEQSLDYVAGETAHPSPQTLDTAQNTGRLQRFRGGEMSCWFQLRKPLRKQIATWERDYTPNEVVNELIEAFPELDAWWETGVEGKHIYRH
ncbi:MAG: hypothetical protein ABJ370_16270 [Paracoccaceae bacterium]